MLALCVLVSTLAGCATTERPRGTVRLPEPTSGFGRDNLTRVQNDVYDAATGPNHVGSTYSR
ncbi:MAG: hypothetical protein NTV51_30705 [Verrucomicrobia bacterium]|nr:hypothetical protein [Verrucomicrobiota bacterium]